MRSQAKQRRDEAHLFSSPFHISNLSGNTSLLSPPFPQLYPWLDRSSLSAPCHSRFNDTFTHLASSKTSHLYPFPNLPPTTSSLSCSSRPFLSFSAPSLSLTSHSCPLKLHSLALLNPSPLANHYQFSLTHCLLLAPRLPPPLNSPSLSLLILLIYPQPSLCLLPISSGMNILLSTQWSPAYCLWITSLAAKQSLFS